MTLAASLFWVLRLALAVSSGYNGMQSFGGEFRGFVAVFCWSFYLKGDHHPILMRMTVTILGKMNGSEFVIVNADAS